LKYKALFNKFKQKNKHMKDPNKHLVKGMIMVILIALLMIPTWYITELVKERKLRKNEITQEVSKTWALPQTISTPYLQMSYARNNVALSSGKYNGYIMSGNCKAMADIVPHKLYRGIYQVPTYQTVMEMTGTFFKKDIDAFINTIGTPFYENSFVAFNITDIKGIADSATIIINNTTYTMSVEGTVGSAGTKALAIPYTAFATAATDISYKIKLTLKGTEKFSFLPMAGSNNVILKSNWKDPSFEGTIATENKKIDNNGFSANWNISKYQTSINSVHANWPNTTESVISVNLINTVDAYTKTMRCTKYALLLIALTFALFYFIEVLKNTQIHPVQYTLVGIGIVVFFTLLLSISEYIGFDGAYSIAALATIALISWYSKGIMYSWGNALTVAAVLSGLYVFMYFIIQLEETSLLIGSIGLFIILAIIMQLSKKVKWNTIKQLPNQSTTTI
jgi:inner membrane protein